MNNDQGTETTTGQIEWSVVPAFEFTNEVQSAFRSAYKSAFFVGNGGGRIYEAEVYLTYEEPSKIYPGGDQASAVHVGSSKAQAVYIGNKKIL